MAALSGVRRDSKVAFHAEGLSLIAIGKAKQEVLDFLKNEDSSKFVGTVADLAKAVNKIIQENGNDSKRAYANGLGIIFSELFEQADEKGFLIDAARIFFHDNLNQIAFVDDLAKQIIALAEEEAELVGEFIPTSEDALELAVKDLVDHIHSNCPEFKAKLEEIAKRPHVDELDLYLDHAEMGAGYSKLFADLIEDAELTGYISDKTKALYYEEGFNQFAFIQRVIQQI